MYVCDNCGARFEEPEQERTTYEHYFGAEWSGGIPYVYEVCPDCGSEDFEEIDEEEEEDEEH